MNSRRCGNAAPVVPKDWELHFQERFKRMTPFERLSFLVKRRAMGAWLLLTHGTNFMPEQLRRLDDLGDANGEYKDDDPRKYGVYFQGESGYVPKPGEQPFVYEEPEPPAQPTEGLRIKRD